VAADGPPDGPPVEAYSRVTNPERFAPLHEIGLKLLHRLEFEFQVDRVEGYGLDPYLETRFSAVALPTVKLTPQNIDGAPVAISFSAFPGLHARFGRWSTRAFPACGCDACDETAEEEAKSLNWIITNIIEGRFKEEIWIPGSGSAWKRTEFWSPDGASESSNSALDRDEAHQLTKEQPSTCQWAPWSKRNG
jgi:hypothetical protein